MKPLEGFTILDFSQFLAGPFASLRLADMGATVIKVERPGTGDSYRSNYGPELKFNGDNAGYYFVNRNKESVSLDLKKQAQREKLISLIQSADAMLINFRADVTDRLGLDYGPGIFLMICLMVTVHFVSKKKGYLGTRTTKVKLADALHTLRDAFWALLIPLGIIMGLRMGVFTATEAGAICVFYCIFVGVFIYKELKISMFPQIIKECVVSTAGVMLIISAAASFGNYMSWEQIPTKLSEVLLTITTNKYVMLILVNLFLLVVGMFLEGTASLIILTPLLVPTMTALGVDPILFGIVMCVNVTLGGITPPFGTLMFLTCSIIKIGIDRFLKESWMLILAMVIGLLAITYIPPITLLLPRLLG